MHREGFRHLPVVEDERPLGIVSSRDALDDDIYEMRADLVLRGDDSAVSNSDASAEELALEKRAKELEKEAKRLQVDISPLPGEAVQATFGEATKLPATVIERYKKILAGT